MSLFLLLYIALSICQITLGQPDPDSESLESPTCSSPPQNQQQSNEIKSPFFDTFIEAYGETVDTIVGLQTTVWNYLGSYHSFDEGEVEGFCDDVRKAPLYTNIPKFERHLKESEKASSKPSEPVPTWDLPEGFRHDRESDVGGYFTELTEGCSKDIGDDAAADRYITECLEPLKSIVYDPRCTTRYDSRVECNGEAPLTLPPPSEIVRDHFGSSPDALHVVIVGAGPIGLMLGNALSMLQKRKREDGSSSTPPIKILFVDTRANAPGFKRGYTRNWQAHLSLLHFRNHLDPRLIKIVAAMGRHKENPESSVYGFVFPLNALETILLLSNRDLGAAKFLFGVNPLDLVDDLKEIPNLVLVDATGHRLDPLLRGASCEKADDSNDNDACPKVTHEVVRNHRTPPAPTISWVNDETEDFYENIVTFESDFSHLHDFMEERGQHLHVGHSGDLMYPVDETTGAAKSMWWLDVHGAMPLRERGFYNEIQAQTEGMFAQEGPFCQWCWDWAEEEEVYSPFWYPESEEDQMNRSQCDKMCYTQYYAQSTDLLRDDINRNIFNSRFSDTFVYHTDSWFPIMGYSFNPSVALATEAEKVLRAHGYSNDPIGMPLRDFYPAMIKHLENSGTELSDSDWEMMEAYERYSLQMNTTKWPTVTLFVQQPFIYTNGIKKKNTCLGKSSTDISDHLEHAPMIRIGDSFTIGDGLSKYIGFRHV
jgi:hypothetical protein